MLRRYNPNKELKKIQGKGIYNRNFKLMIIGSVFALTALIAASFALWSFASEQNVAFNGKATKMLTIDLSAGNNASVGLFSAKILKDNVVRTEIPDFTKGYPLTSDTSSSGLYAMEDNDGTSYYFRGKIDNNYVNFANNTWRIIRINGDGTIRIMLDTNIGTSPFYTNPPTDAGYTYNNTNNCTKENPCISDYTGTSFIKSNGMGENSAVKNYLESWYIKNLATYNDKIALGTFWNDTSIESSMSNYDLDNYAALTRLNKGLPLLKTIDPTDLNSTNTHNYGGVYKLKIGLITADELVLGGLSPLERKNEATSNNYLYKSSGNADFWTMTPIDSTAEIDRIYRGLNGYLMQSGMATDSKLVYPVINLKPDVSVSGSGTIDNPYVVSNTYTTSNIKVSVKYNTDTRIKIYPKSGYALNIMDCNDEEGVFQNIKYDRETNEIIMNAQSDLTCMLDYKPNLKSTILANNSVVTTKPDFLLGSPNVGEKNIENVKGFLSAPDNDGTSYYFRGAVTNNNVTFAGKKWKIVRINGDGSVRIVLTDTSNLSSAFDLNYNTGYTYNNTTACTKLSPCISDFNGSTFQKSGGMGIDSTAKTNLETWYKNNLTSYDDRIALTTYCNDTSNKGSYSYSGESRMFAGTPSLVCPNPTDSSGNSQNVGGIYKLKIGLLTTDEYNMAGAGVYYSDYAGSSFYLYGVWGLSMTPRDSGRMQGLDVYLQDTTYSYDSAATMQPVINLIPGVDFSVNSGTAGTSSNPYVIK